MCEAIGPSAVTLVRNADGCTGTDRGEHVERD